MKRLPRSFYENSDVVDAARMLIGKRLITHINGSTTGGIITETEAYAGTTDRASHAYGGRRTARTEVMYMRGGTAYVYLCYGMHALFNIVTHAEGVPHAVLIRSIKPDTGIEVMKQRRTIKETTPRLTAGPGNLTKALGITVKHTGLSLLGNSIWLEYGLSDAPVLAAMRIGVDYAGPDARQPWRFLLDGSPWVTYPKSH